MSDRPIRVLHSELAETVGGIEMLFLNLCSEINPEIVTFDFITCADKPALGEELEKLGAHVIRLPSYTRRPFAYMAALKSLLEQGRYDYVHIHKNSTANILPLLVAKASRTGKVLCHAHSTTTNGGGIAVQLHRFNKKFLHLLIDDAFTCSDLAANWLYSHKAKRLFDIKMLPNGIHMDAYEFDPAVREQERKKLGLSDELAICMVSRISPPKNHAFAIDLFAHFLSNSNFPNAKLVIVGDGPLLPELRRTVASKKLESNVLFAGYRDDVSILLNAFDVFLMPSFFEGLPLSAVEAQANGLPCLVSDRITRECAISDAIEYLPIDKGCDVWTKALERFALSKRGPAQEISKKFDIRQVSKTLSEYYTRQLVDEL